MLLGISVFHNLTPAKVIDLLAISNLTFGSLSLLRLSLVTISDELVIKFVFVVLGIRSCSSFHMKPACF